MPKPVTLAINIEIADPDSPNYDPGDLDFAAAVLMLAELKRSMGMNTDRQEVMTIDGDSVQMTNNGLNGVLFLNTTGTISDFTATLPNEDNARPNQIRRIYSKGNIENFVLNGASIIDGNIGSMNDKDFYTFIRIAPDHWARLTS